MEALGARLTFEDALRIVGETTPPTGREDMATVLSRWPAMLRYDPLSGRLSWRLMERNLCVDGGSSVATRYVGRLKRAGVVDIDGMRVSSAKLVWLLHHGAWPVEDIGRRDGDVLNDRIENLFDKGVEPKRPVGRPPGTGAKRAGPSAWITGSPGALKAWGKGPHCKLFLGLFTDNATALAACEAFERGEDLV